MVPAAAQRAHLAGKIPGGVYRYQRLAGEPGQDDLDRAGEDDEQTSIPVAGLRQHLAGADAFPISICLEPVDLRRRELREHLLPAGLAEIRHQRPLSAASIASNSTLGPNDASWMRPFTKKPGVPRTWLRRPPSMCSRTRWRYKCSPISES